jgi:antitoxin component YwqK of YwqJK toxin-antitoxin module
MRVPIRIAFLLACAAVACSKPVVTITRFGDDAIASECTRVDGVLEGPFLLFHSGGVRHVECAYTGGLRHGRYAEWYPNGAPVATGMYEHGLRVGEWQEWTEEGLPVTKGSFRSGDKDGVWILYDALGKPRYEDTWSLGTRLTRRTL